MSYSSPSKWILGLAALWSAACGGGETAPADFGDGPDATEKPPASAQGESTPSANFAGCQAGEEASACGNACFACVEDATPETAEGEDDTLDTAAVDEILTCIYGVACQTYFAQYADPIGDNGPDPDANILLEPDAEPIDEPNECDFESDLCAFCLCSTDNDQVACMEACAQG